MLHKLEKMRLDSLLVGVHLTDGCSLLPGICELAAEVFGIPVPRARLKGFSGRARIFEEPRLSCALGLVKRDADITKIPTI